MPDTKTQASSGGVGILTVLLVVFIVLKLTGLITWSWVWVLSPFWLPLVSLFILVLIMAVVVSITGGK